MTNTDINKKATLGVKRTPAPAPAPAPDGPTLNQAPEPPAEGGTVVVAPPPPGDQHAAPAPLATHAGRTLRAGIRPRSPRVLLHIPAVFAP